MKRELFLGTVFKKDLSDTGSAHVPYKNFNKIQNLKNRKRRVHFSLLPATALQTKRLACCLEGAHQKLGLLWAN